MNRTAVRRLPFDPWLLGSLATLLLGGLVLLASASSVTAFRQFGSSFALFNRQLFSLALGLALCGFTLSIEYRRWRSWSFVLLLGVMALLVLVFFPGIGATLQGARRWIHLGPIFIQPSELAKPVLVLALALWLERESGRSLTNERALPFLLPVAIIAGLVLMQPDLGTVLVITLTAIVLYLAAGAPLKQVASLLLLLAVIAGIATAAHPYRLQRIQTFLNPAADPSGSGYHVSRAIAAVQAGGWFGVGYGRSVSKTGALPEPESDSIFAVATEELGVISGAALIALYGIVAVRGFAVARRAPDAFARNVAIGITVSIVGQAFVNIGALTGVVPLTGVPLPLVSYGGSSLIATLAAVGILLSIDRAGSRR